MKSFIKTASLTLVISITALFFSSSEINKVEAAGSGAVIGAAAAVSVIGSMIIGIATYLGDKLPVVNVKDFVYSPDFESSISVSEDGTAVFNHPSPFPSKINETVFNATAREAVKEYNSQLRVHIFGEELEENNRIPGSVFNAAVSSAILGVLGSEALADPDNPSGSTAGITLGVSTVNGKPQKVTTTYIESTVDVFDYLGLKYNTFNSITDINLYIDTKGNVDSNITETGYYLPFIIKGDTLYVFGKNNCSYIKYSVSKTNGRSFYIYNYGEFYNSHNYMSFRFAKIGEKLCFATFGCSRYDNYNPIRVNRAQKIYGSPAPSSYPILFNTPSYYNVGEINTSFDNFDLNTPIAFVNPSDTTDIISEADILNSSFDICGYFKSVISSPFTFSGSIGTAAKMLSGTENAVQGGTNTTYSDLSDIEKAIYALAKQNGKTYDEMLEQSNLVVENGQIYLEGLDGMTHTIESLLAEFDKLLEQGGITNENIAASTEQLKAILEYLKGLNIEGLGEYIQQLEATLDGLKQGDEDREAILGDVLGQLQGLNDYINSLDIESIGANIKSITDSLSDFITAFKDTLFDGMTAPKVSFDYTPGDIIEHYTEQFPLYEQCKKLINNLFNYDDVLEPPNFSFYWDSDGDGVKEVYNPFDFSILEIKLTNENMVDKSIFAVEIKVIDLIRYILAVIIYGFFVMRLIRRLPTLYGSGPFASM